MYILLLTTCIWVLVLILVLESNSIVVTCSTGKDCTGVIRKGCFQSSRVALVWYVWVGNCLALNSCRNKVELLLLTKLSLIRKSQQRGRLKFEREKPFTRIFRKNLVTKPTYVLIPLKILAYSCECCCSTNGGHCKVPWGFFKADGNVDESVVILTENSTAIPNEETYESTKELWNDYFSLILTLVEANSIPTARISQFS